jgi:uncharacterized protein with PIN domain
MKKFRCPDCNSICIEVGKPIYPKDIYEPKISKIYHEYRYACLKCRKEWMHDTLLKLIFEVPDDSQYYYDFENKQFKKRT